MTTCMHDAPGWKNRLPGILTKMVNFDGTLVEKRKSIPCLDLRPVSWHAIHAETTPLPPPKRSADFVNTPPDFFHPYSPHMSLSRPKHGFPHSRT